MKRYKIAELRKFKSSSSSNDKIGDYIGDRPFYYEKSGRLADPDKISFDGVNYVSRRNVDGVSEDGALWFTEYEIEKYLNQVEEPKQYITVGHLMVNDDSGNTTPMVTSPMYEREALEVASQWVLTGKYINVAVTKIHMIPEVKKTVSFKPL